MHLYLSEVIRGYLADCRRRGLSESTIQNYQERLFDLLTEVGDRPINAVHLDHLRAWVDAKIERGLSRHTIWSAVVTARIFFNWCVEEGLLDASPARRLQRPRLPRPQPKALREAEIHALLRAARAGMNPERDEAIILFFLETGARRSAVANLRMENFLLEEGVALTWTKGQKEVWLFFDQPIVKDALTRWFAVRDPSLFHPAVPPDSVFGLTSDGLRLLLRRLRRRAGIQRRVSPHILRHTSAVMRAEQGIDSSSLQQIMGWEDIRMAEVYTRMARERIKRRASRTSPVAALFRSRPSQ